MDEVRCALVSEYTSKVRLNGGREVNLAAPMDEGDGQFVQITDRKENQAFDYGFR